jgi:hypothetical protein
MQIYIIGVWLVTNYTNIPISPYNLSEIPLAFCRNLSDLVEIKTHFDNQAVSIKNYFQLDENT